MAKVTFNSKDFYSLIRDRLVHVQPDSWKSDELWHTFIFTFHFSLKAQPSPPVSRQPWYMVPGAVITPLHSLHPLHCNCSPILLSSRIQILLLLAIVDSRRLIFIVGVGGKE